MCPQTSELEDLTELYRKCKREYASTRTDAEGMLQVMSSLERSVHELTAKEHKLEGVVKECRGRMEEALRQRDQAVTRDVQNQREIQRLLEERKSCIQTKQVPSTVWCVSVYILNLCGCRRSWRRLWSGSRGSVSYSIRRWTRSCRRSSTGTASSEVQWG